MELLLIINPGSTSTKVAVYDGDRPVFSESISHSPESLAPFRRVTDQLNLRRDLVWDCLRRRGVDPESLSAVVSRGGLLPPIRSGAYRVNEDMVWQLRNRPQHQHASNVGPLIAWDISRSLGIPAWIYDGVTMDELWDINRITGLPGMERKSMGHNLNTRAAALRYARETGRDYRDLTLIVVHLGGGITVNLHHKGQVVDNVNDEEGPFSPERAGGLPLFDVIDACFVPGADREELLRLVKSRGGLLAHLGTTDSRRAEELIAAGDARAKLVYDAMILNTAKHVGKLAPEVRGKIDAILLTGGIANSKYVTDALTDYVSFLAPVAVYPGENEMQALAEGGLRVLRGEEQAREFVRDESFGRALG